MPTALITGVTGQDGSYLSEKLIAAGWTVHGMVRPGVNGEQPVSAGIVTHTGDLADSASVTAAIEASDPDVLFNLAGISSVAQSWSDPVLTGSLTGLAVATMLETCWRLGERRGAEVRFIQASSAEIFALATDDPQVEATPVQPSSPYGAAKAYAHQMVGIYRQRGMSASAAILYNHESPRRPPTFVTRKITMGVAAIAQGRASVLELGNLDAQRDWGWAPDFMDALIAMASAPRAGDYVVATGVTHSVRDFVTAAFARVGIDDPDRHIVLNDGLSRPTDAPTLRGDPSLIRRDLGWTPTKGFDEIVAAMVDHDIALGAGRE